MRNRTKLFGCISRSPLLAVAVSFLWIPLSVAASAQSSNVSQVASEVATVIPQQVRYTGALPNRAGATVEVVFNIYPNAEGGEPLWTETQQVAVGADGTYTVLLGAVSENGLPQTVFAAGQARWVGVSVDRAAELSRSPLASVAYAMKAGDAESVGGLVAASLATKDDLARLTKLAQTSAVAAQAQPQVQIQPEDAPSGSGTTNYVPLWTASGTLGSSGIFQAPSGFLGVGTTTPGGPLELATGATGGANATMMLEQTSAASGNYYADIGLYNTHGLIGNLSALGAGYPAGNLFGANDVVFLGGQQNAGTNLIFLTNTSGALKFGTGGYAISNERLRIGATGGVSVGNPYVGTDPGSGNMILSGKFGIGTTAPAANLEVNGTAKFDGLITFGVGQTFPGTGAGTITGVSTTSPLTGSGTSGTITVGLNTSALEMTLSNVYAQLGVSNTFAYAATFSTGLTANMTLGSGHAAVDGIGTNGSYGVMGSSDTSRGVEGTSASGTAVYGGSGSGKGLEGVSTSGTGVNGTSTSGNAGNFSNSVANLATVYAANSGNFIAGGPNPVALNATSTGSESVGAYGTGTKFGVWGDTPTMGASAFHSSVGDAYGGNFENNGTDYPAVQGSNRAAGSASTTPTVFEATASGINAYAFYTDVTGNGSYGLYAESDGGRESGSGRSAVGVKGVAAGADGNGMVGDATGTGGYGVYARASGLPDNTRYASAGVYALADQGIGVEGFSGGQSALYGFYQDSLGVTTTAGVWGDTSASSESAAMGGIVGTADDNRAGYFENNSKTSHTIEAMNDNGSGSSGLFKVFKASTAAGTCGIGDGDLSCTGQLKTLASTGGGTRTVETYATQSAENWMEDYGTGAMEGGVGVVQIDPGFAETVTGDASYHVFLTPRGDSKGLYVTHATASSFEVRESGGGTSSISFDYKIVAKRRGYEAQRLIDVTERFNVEQAETKRMMPTSSARALKGMMEPQMLEHPQGLESGSKLNTAMPNERPGAAVSAPQAPVIRLKPVSPSKQGTNPIGDN